MTPIDKCYGEDCVTLGYSIIGDPSPEAQQKYQWIDEIMKTVSLTNNLEFGKDVKKLTVGSP